MLQTIPKTKILSTQVSLLTSYTHAIQIIDACIRGGDQLTCAAVNPEKVELALSESGVQSILSKFEMTICDGVGLTIAVQLLKKLSIPRITGCDLAHQLLAHSSSKGYKAFLLGGDGDSNEAAISNLKVAHPRLDAAGHHGYFSDSEQIVRAINNHETDVLFVGMGSPRQESWIQENRSRICAKFIMGVGGTIDIIAGRSKRAPSLIRKTGFEFLYRLIRHPTRFRRQLILPKFAFRVLYRRLRGQNQHSDASQTAGASGHTTASL